MKIPKINFRSELEIFWGEIITELGRSIAKNFVIYLVSLTISIIIANVFLAPEADLRITILFLEVLQGVIIQVKLSLDLIPLLLIQTREHPTLRKEIVLGAVKGDFKSVIFTLGIWMVLSLFKPLLLFVSIVATLMLLSICRKSFALTALDKKHMKKRTVIICNIISAILLPVDIIISPIKGLLPDPEPPHFSGDITPFIRKQTEEKFSKFANLMGIDNAIGVGALFTIYNVYSVSLGVMLGIALTGFILAYASKKQEIAQNVNEKPSHFLHFIGGGVLGFVSCESFVKIWEEAHEINWIGYLDWVSNRIQHLF